MFNSSNESSFKFEDLGSLVAQYESMAEKLAMELLLQTEISKQYAVAQQVAVLKEKVESSLQSSEFQKKSAPIDRLRQVYKYIQENFSHIQLISNGKEEADHLD